MSSVKRYYSARQRKTFKWAFEGGQGRIGEPHQREYHILIQAVSGDQLIASVESYDLDAAGNRFNRVPDVRGLAKVSLSKCPTPADALEMAARFVDPTYFDRHPTAVASATSTEDELAERLAALEIPENRGNDEITPAPESVARLKTFWKENPGLFLPTLFSSKDGTVRARWQHGHDHTLWVSFPAKGALPWSIMIPRVGNSGMRRMNARCPSDQDLIPMARLLGVTCGR